MTTEDMQRSLDHALASAIPVKGAQETIEDAMATAIVADMVSSRLIQERGKTHGDYNNTARYIQALKQVIYRGYSERAQRGQPPLTPAQKESLEMVAHKMGRILSGDASFADHWDDIGGYASIANKDF
jgi:hypothetical protein